MLCRDDLAISHGSHGSQGRTLLYRSNPVTGLAVCILVPNYLNTVEVLQEASRPRVGFIFVFPGLEKNWPKRRPQHRFNLNAPAACVSASVSSDNLWSNMHSHMGMI